MMLVYHLHKGWVGLAPSSDPGPGPGPAAAAHTRGQPAGRPAHARAQPVMGAGRAAAPAFGDAAAGEEDGGGADAGDGGCGGDFEGVVWQRMESEPAGGASAAAAPAPYFLASGGAGPAAGGGGAEEDADGFAPLDFAAWAGGYSVSSSSGGLGGFWGVGAGLGEEAAASDAFWSGLRF